MPALRLPRTLADDVADLRAEALEFARTLFYPVLVLLIALLPVAFAPHDPAPEEVDA